MIKLHGSQVSGNTHKVRNMLGLLGLDHELVAVDLPAGEHKAAPFLALNPLGEIPVLVDGATTLRDSAAILVYLASNYAPGDWLPSDPAGLGEVMQWLSFASNQIHQGPFTARAIVRFKRPGDLEAARQRSAAVFAVMDSHLDGRDWLARDRRTIADIACYTYITLAGEAGVDQAPYANVTAWLARVEALPGFVAPDRG